MKKIFKQQLNNVKAVDIKFDDNTKSIFIPKTVEVKKEALEIGSVYLIEVEDFIIHPDSTSTLASNWNQGKTPKNKRYVAELQANVSKMYKWNGVAQEDPTDNWFGWFPQEGFSIIEKL